MVGIDTIKVNGAVQLLIYKCDKTCLLTSQKCSLIKVKVIESTYPAFIDCGMC